MFLILLLLFTCVPALELYLLFQVGGEIGALNTILIIILTGVVGAAMAKSQGLELLFKIQTKLNEGELPTGQLLQGFLVMGGGLLLLTPGFITDILGFAMVLPGSRGVLAALIKKAFSNQIKRGNVHIFTHMGSSHSGPFNRRESPMNDFFRDQNLDSGVEHKEDSETFEAEYTKKNED